MEKMENMDFLNGTTIPNEYYTASQLDPAEYRNQELTLRLHFNDIFRSEDVTTFLGRSMPLDIFLKRYGNAHHVKRRARDKHRLICIMMEELTAVGIIPKLIQSDGSEVFLSFKLDEVCK